MPVEDEIKSDAIRQNYGKRRIEYDSNFSKTRYKIC